MSEKKKWLGMLLAVCLGISLLLTLIPTPGMTDNPKKIVLRYADTGSATSARGKIENEYLKRVEEMSGGRVEFARYWSQSLLKSDDMIAGTGRGVAHVGEVYMIYAPSKLPLTNVSMLPGGKEHPSQAIRALKDLWVTEPLIRKEWDQNNVVPIWWHAGGGYCIVSTKPIRKLEDLKGLKIRAVGVDAKIFDQAGAAVVSMPFSEVFEALQRGTIDSAACVLLYSSWDYKFYEICDYFIYPYPNSCPTLAMFMNKGTWNGLPKDIQEVFKKAAEGYAERTDLHYGELDGKAVANWKKAGKDVYVFPEGEFKKWQAFIQPVYDEWIADKEAKGLPGRRIYNLWRELLEKYKPMGKYEPMGK